MSKTDKKFYNINRWDQKFFMDLSPVQKLAWEYVNDKSDNIGVWEPNLKILQFHIGGELDVDNFFQMVNEGETRLIELPEGNWFVPAYVKFQYCKSKPLKPTSPAHRSYLKDMESRGLLGYFIEEWPDVMSTSANYREVLDEKELKKVPKAFQSFLDTFSERSNRLLKDPSENYKEKETEKEADTEEDTDKESATDSEKDSPPHSGNGTQLNPEIFGDPSVQK